MDNDKVITDFVKKLFLNLEDNMLGDKKKEVYQVIAESWTDTLLEKKENQEKK